MGRAELQAGREAILSPLRAAPRDGGRRVFRVALLGDLYTMSEPFFNMNLEQRLGEQGVQVERWLWLSSGSSCVAGRPADGHPPSFPGATHLFEVRCT